jgi:hypothetical protein
MLTFHIYILSYKLHIHKICSRSHFFRGALNCLSSVTLHSLFRISPHATTKKCSSLQQFCSARNLEDEIPTVAPVSGAFTHFKLLVCSGCVFCFIHTVLCLHYNSRYTLGAARNWTVFQRLAIFLLHTLVNAEGRGIVSKGKVSALHNDLKHKIWSKVFWIQTAFRNAFVLLVNSWTQQNIPIFYWTEIEKLFMFVTWAGGCRPCSRWFLARGFFLLPWRRRRYIPPKRRFTQYLHGAISQKTAFSKCS